MKKTGKIIISILLLMILSISAVILITPAKAAGDGENDLIVYGTYTNFCYRLVRVTDKKVWDHVNDDLTIDPTYSDTEKAVTIDQTVGGYPIDLDESLPAGEYDLLIYDTASPAYTDVPSVGKRIKWTGRRLNGLPQDI